MKEFQGLHLINNGFWNRVATVWLGKKSENLPEPSNVDGCTLHSPLFNNKYIKLNNKPIFLLSCIKKDIIKVGDMLSKETSDIITFDEFESIYGRRGDTR